MDVRDMSPLTNNEFDVVIDKDWHHVKGKTKRKLMNVQRNSLPTTHDTTRQGTLGTRPGTRKVSWQQQSQDKGLCLQIQCDSLGCVVNPSNPRGFHRLENLTKRFL